MVAIGNKKKLTSVDLVLGRDLAALSCDRQTRSSFVMLQSHNKEQPETAARRPLLCVTSYSTEKRERWCNYALSFCSLLHGYESWT